jgi:hypothetical protein
MEIPEAPAALIVSQAAMTFSAAAMFAREAVTAFLWTAYVMNTATVLSEQSGVTRSTAAATASASHMSTCPTWVPRPPSQFREPLGRSVLEIETMEASGSSAARQLRSAVGIES